MYFIRKVSMNNIIKFSIVFFLSLFFLSNPYDYLANEKSIDIPISKDYEGCTFTIKVDTAGDYDILLYAPNGESFSFEQLPAEPTTYICTITNVKIGKWKAVINNNSNSEVGKVSVSVTAAKVNNSDINHEVQIGKEIVGLKMFLKNNTFVASWTDNSCENVSFTIIDLSTSNVISTEKSNSKKYEKILPEGTKDISVVVSSSRINGIEGTSNTYIINGMDLIDGNVEFPNLEYTNNDEIYVNVSINRNYAFYVEVNGKEVTRQDTHPTGTYEVEIPLIADGKNDIKFFFVDDNGNMLSSDYTIFRDETAPILTLSQEYDGMITKDSSITIEGVAQDFDIFTINDEVITTEKNGAFSYDTNLIEGDNKITLLLKDKAGNETFYNIVISVPVSNRGIPPFMLLVLAAFIIYLAFFRKKKSKHGRKDNKTAQNSEFDVSDSEFVTKEEKMANLGELKPSEGISQEDIFLERERMKSHSKENPLTKSRRFLEKLSFLKYIAYVVFLILFFTFVLKPGHVSSGSMEPTIMTHDIVVFNRLAYISKEPQVNDIISFNHNNETYCKRIIGVGGDEIFFADGYVYRNGERVEEKFLDEDIETNCTKSFIVPEGFVFVLGDNRENSYDSRYWENPYVDVNNIVGKTLIVIPISTN